jgi:FKBP-type peptidyl-prolyl cis-trans isomerase (trigger factor)
VEELEERIRGRIAADNEQRERERQAHAALDAILELKPFQLSPRMIQEEAEASRKSNIERMQQQGATEEQATAEADKHADDMEVDAERRLKHWFILRRLAQQEKVRVSSRDLDNAFRAIAQQQGVDVGMLKKFYKERNMTDNLRGEILESKVRAHLVDKLAELRQASLSAPLES